MVLTVQFFFGNGTVAENQLVLVVLSFGLILMHQSCSFSLAGFQSWEEETRLENFSIDDAD